MAALLYPSRLRSSTPRDVALYLREALKNSTDADITDELISLIERGSIPPTIFTIWLGASRSSSAIRQGLHQSVSLEVRSVSIKHFKCWLRSARWRDAWDGVGGVPGLLDLFSDLSVDEIREACRAIGCSARGGDRAAKRHFITQLLKSLLPHVYPDAPYKSSDQRPLEKYYLSLVPGCSEDLVSGIVEDVLQGGKNWISRKILTQHHPEILQASMLRYISGGCPAHGGWLVPLLSQRPSIAGPIPGFSASMTFALEVVRNLAKNEQSPLSNESYLRDLVEPLLKRAIKKRVEMVKIQEIVDLTLPYLEKNPEMVKSLDLRYRSLLHLVASCWARKPDMFQSQFAFLLSYKCGDVNTATIGQFDVLLQGIPLSRRYALLRFCFESVTERDLDVEGDLKDIKEPLGWSILEKLPGQEAFGLFTRMRNAKGDECLVQRYSVASSVLGNSPAYGAFCGDPDIYCTILLRRIGHKEDAERLASRCGQARRKLATSSSSPEQRAFYAKCALHYGIASGSLAMCKEAFVWARRFLRDPLTVGWLHSHYPSELIALLSGFPDVCEKDLATSELCGRIKAANQILEELFETYCSALHEPSYQPQFWNGIRGLFFLVVDERILRSPKLKKNMGLTDEALHTIVWEDTIRMLVAMEEKAFSISDEYWQHNATKGILSYGAPPSALSGRESLSVYRFLDQLARARDELWCRYRLATQPPIASLPDPFQRGLCLQDLTGPYVLDAAELESLAPYIASRMKAAVFIPPTLAFRTVPEGTSTQNAALAVDDYGLALRMLAPKALDKLRRKRRVQEAWRHAIGPLGRAWESEAHMLNDWRAFLPFLGRCLDRWTREVMVDSHVEGWPNVPAVDSPTQAQGWVPMPSSNSESVIREPLDRAYICVSIKTALANIPTSTELVNGPGRLTNRSAHRRRHKREPRAEWDGIWSTLQTRLAKHSGRMREGQILSALLYLETFGSSQNSILKTPFPSEKDSRYPSLYLVAEFLQDLNRDTDAAMDAAITALFVHIKSVPPTLLGRVAHDLYNAFDAADSLSNKSIRRPLQKWKVERKAFSLIKLLTQSDRPALGSKLAVNYVLRHHDLSSWHRQLLSVSFIRRLSASEAQACICAFSAAIVQRLEDQVKGDPSPAIEAKDASTKTPSSRKTLAKEEKNHIKITTVKMLVELLTAAQVVSENFALSILSKLIYKASHIDIRGAVVDSFLYMLASDSQAVAGKILPILKTVIPVAGNLHERNPVSDTDWKHAAETLELPEFPAQQDWENSAPILKSLLSVLKRAPQAFPHRRIVLERIILPIVKHLKAQTAQWTSLFLKKQGFDAAAQRETNVPSMPREKEILQELLAVVPSDLPLSLLEEYVTYLKFTIAPPTPIQALNKKLKDDLALRKSTDVEAWLRRYANGPATVPHHNTFSLIHLLRDPSRLTGPITPKAIQAQFLTLYTAMLWNDSELFSRLERLTRPLWPFTPSPKPLIPGNPLVSLETWATHYKPVIDAIILYTESIRTREWERDPARRPKLLPDTFEYRMWLLQYSALALNGPSSGTEPSDPDAQCKTFAARVAKLIEQLAGSLYHKKLARLQTALQYVRDDNALRVACFLGDITQTRLSWLTMLDLLRVEVAAGMLLNRDQGGAGGSAEVRSRVEGVTRSWCGSETEEVRRWGFVVEGRGKRGMEGGLPW